MDPQDTPDEPAPDEARRAARGQARLAHDAPAKDTREQVERAGIAWRQRAHAAQLPPDGDWSTWLFMGGRGAGKTRAGAEWIADLATRNPGSRFALIAPTEHDLREVMIEGVSGLLNLPDRDTPKYNSSRRRLVWTNGSIAHGFSAEEPERLRGPQFDAAWADEFCVWKRADYVLSTLRLALRRGAAPRLMVTTTPRQRASLESLMAEATCVITRASTDANAANLSKDFLQIIMTLYDGTDLIEQEVLGKLIDGDGVMWRREDFVEARGAAPEKLERVFVAVDPPAGSEVGRRGSACGIVVAAIAGGVAHVLADRSVLGLKPEGWTSRVVGVAREFGAAEIVAECNQGGDMVETLLRQAGPPCRLRLVRAMDGKRARAQPVYQAYQLGRVKHCGRFPELEDQLIALGQGEGGPYDRADALVWAVTELLLRPPAARPRIESLVLGGRR
jgi:phage terminase large subunit-like protein